MFDQVLFDGIELSSRMENVSNSTEKFYIYYKMKLSENGKWMEGSAQNSRQQTFAIKWEKISDK